MAPAHGLPTPPPDSPEKRRRLLRESDDTAGILSIERYLYSSDAFRKTSRSEPLPLPVRLGAPPPYVEAKMTSLRPRIKAIMNWHEVTDVFAADFFLLSKPGYPGGDIKRLTLYIEFRGIAGTPDSWADIRSALHGLLIKDNMNGVDVEIIDTEQAFMLSLFPIKPSAGSIAFYRSIRERILSRLFSQIRNEWTSLGIFNVGRSAEKVTTKIVIFVIPGSQHDWQNLIWALRGVIIPNLPKGRELDIEILPGTIQDLPGVSFSGILSPSPSLGCSIGISQETGSGTLGGFVDLITGGQRFQGALTNHHVVQPADSAPESVHQMTRGGYRLFSTGQNPPSLQYPSKDDLAATLEGNEGLLKLAQDAVEKKKKEIEFNEMVGKPVHPYLKNENERAQNRLRSLDREKAELNRLPMDIGKVLVSSGRLLDAKPAKVDWAFIHFPPSLTTNIPLLNRLNRLPGYKNAGFDGKLPENFGLNYLYNATDDPPSYATAFSTIEKGQWYFKVGRSTGLTVGLCHGEEIDVNRRGEVFFNDKGDQVRYEISRELVIIGYEPSKEPKVQSTFCLMGDSGSFVFDHNGRVAGLLHGYLHGGVTTQDGRTVMMTNVAQVTSMDKILPSIAARSAMGDAAGNMVPGRLELPRQ